MMAPITGGLKVKKVSLFVVFGLLCLMLLPGMLAAAQSGLDSSLESNYGVYTIEAGFLPDPWIFPMYSGGDVDAGRQNLGVGCSGNVTSQPDLVIDWATASQNLHIFFVGMDDTTLIVELPDGSYACNDDTVGTDPSVNISNPAGGDYSIWVGTFGAANDYVPGYLMVTEFEDSLPGSIVTNLPNFVTVYEDFGIESPPSTGDAATPSTPNTSQGGGALNPDGAATYGTSTLQTGFSPDPTSVQMSSGGSVDVTALQVGNGCRGFTADNPDYRVEWSGAGDLLRIFFVSAGDTTLIVRTPSGEYVCNDDFGGLNPLVDIVGPAAGSYEVWVGTFGVDEVIPGSLYITGSDSSDPASVS